MSLTFSGAEPQPSLAWQFESSNVDYVTNLTPSAQVSPGPAQLQGGASLVTNAPSGSNTAVYFPGTTGAYMDLGASSTTNINQNTSNIFVEAWVYFNDLTINNRVFNRGLNTVTSSSVDIVFRTEGTSLMFNYGSGGFAGAATASGLTTGTWIHVAMSSRVGGLSYVFINGNPGTGFSPSVGTYNASYTTFIGVGGSVYANMYIRDLRVVQGGVVPVATFTPLASAPFSYASPTYVPNMGTTVFTLLGQFITYVPGKYNQAISFANGTNVTNYITTGTLPVTLSNTAGFTCSFWINFNPAIVTNQYPLALYNGDTSKLVFYFVVTTGLSAFRGDPATRTGAATANMSLVPSASTWYHMALTVTATTWNAYINGAIRPEASGAYTSANLTGINGPLWIGGYNGGFGLTGLIDDLRIYNTALTAAQVQSVYSSQGAPAPSRAMPLPKLAWDFNGTTTPYIGSATGTTNGTITYTPGKFNQAITFPNSSGTGANNVSYSTTSIPVDSGITVALWVKFNQLQDSYFFVMGSIFFKTQGAGMNWFMVNNGLYPGGSLGTYAVNTWYHLVLSIGNMSVGAYFNGALQATTAYTTSGTTVANPRIGAEYNQGINGLIDDLRIFDRALTSAQVQAIYNQQGVPGRGVMTINSYITDGLVAYYDTQNLRYPNSVSGTTWYDISGNGRSVTIRPGSSYNSAGKYITFDGTVNSGTTVAQSGQSLTRWTVMCAFMQTANGTSWARVAGSSPAYDAGEIALNGQTLAFNPPENTGWTSTSFTTTYNVWYHMCIAFDTTTTGVVDVWVYIDGALVNSYTIDGTVESLTGYTIGARNDFNNEAMIGRMSLFAIYNRVLSQSEVSANYEIYKKTQTTILDPSFESYFSLIGAPGFLYNPSPSSWTFSNGGAGAVAIKSGNATWGSVPAQDGQVFLGLQTVQSISQTISSLVPRGVYTVTWWQRARPTYVGNDINVSLGGTSVYNETNITNSSSWTQRTSSSWISPGTSVVLQFYTTNPLGGDRTTFIDNVSISRTFVPIQLTGTPLFNQLSQAARSSAVGAFSLRAVNGTTAKAVAVTQYTLLEVPPVALTQNTFTATGTFNGVTNGQYVALCSNYNAGSDAYRCFDKNSGTRGITGGTQYTVGTGDFIGSASTVDSTSTTYNGAWFQISIPSAVNAVSYSLSVNSILTLTAPYTWKLFGSTTGSSGSWVVLDTKTSYVFATPTVNFPLSQISAGYTYFRLAANMISPSSSTGGLGPAEIIIYGYSSLVSATQDFYADRLGNLLTAPVTGQSLANWLGGATGYVTTWYNQIQPGQDVSATVAANQPTIDPVNKTIVFNGTNQSFSNTATTGGLLAASAGTGTKYTYTASWNKVVGSAFGRILEHNAQNSASNQASSLLAFEGTCNFSGQDNDATVCSYTVGNQTSVVMRVDNTTSNNIKVRCNGTNSSSATYNYATLSLNNYRFVIGRKGTTNNEFFNGSIKNVMVFKDAISDADTAVLDTWQQSL